MAKAKAVELHLKNLSYGLKLVKDDRYRIYHNEKQNVTIFAIAYCKDESIGDVFNGITEEPYTKLIDFMNENENLIIKWTKVEGTTSDYTIYCDCDYDGDWNIIDLDEYLWELCPDKGDMKSYKYTIVEDEKMRKF